MSDQKTIEYFSAEIVHQRARALIAFAQGSPAPPIPTYLFVAILVALGGLILLTTALALVVIAAALILKNKPKAPKTAQAPVSDPEMPIAIEAELSFATGDPYDSDPDTIATEVFVRAESLPPEEAETIDELPGVLKARRKPN